MPQPTSGRPTRRPTLPPTVAARLSALDLAVRAGVFSAAMSLPPPVMRRLAGRPMVVDGATLSAQSQLALRLQRWTREKPAESLPIALGRLAVRRQATLVGGKQPVRSVEDRTVGGAAGTLPARLYLPASLPARAAGEDGADPLLVFFHGGGMVYGDLDSHDAVCRFLAHHAQARVLAVDYRLAPEHPFPAGADDAEAAYAWVVDHAAELGADPARLAVAGDSAGAYLAAVAALRAAAQGWPLAYQLLIYPVTDMAGGSQSRRTFGKDLYLTTEFMDLATDSYLAGADPRDPRASVIHAEIPAGLAPAFVATAGFDPLRDEGEAYVEKLRAAGVEVHHVRYPGEIHGFANILSVEGTPRQAMLEMAQALGKALA